MSAEAATRRVETKKPEARMVSEKNDMSAAATVSSGSEQDDVSTSNQHRNKLAIDTPVAPLLARAPFDHNDRKKAYKSAVYYSECYMKGVQPKDADNAAKDVQGTYNKWWIDSNFKEGKDPVDDLQFGTRSPGGLLKRSRFSNDGNSYRKRQRRRGGVRDVIDAVTLGYARSSSGIMGLTTLDAGACVSSSSGDENVVHSAQASSLLAEHRVSPEPSSTDESSAFAIRSIPNLSTLSSQQIQTTKEELIAELEASGGDTEKSSFLSKLAILHSHYVQTGLDARSESCGFDLEGSWLTLSKPTYSECRGRNESGHYMYSLGRMAFDMFRPTNLTCSIQGIFNTVHKVNSPSDSDHLAVPRSLRKQVRADHNLHDADIGLRTYNIVVALTTEPERDDQRPSQGASRPLRGIMTNYGYFLPDPHVPNRLSIWFTGGSLEVNDEQEDLEEWKRTFHHDHIPKRDLSEYARVLATKILLGARVDEDMQEDGTMSYYLKRPIGGHGCAFCDVLYLDESLRIMRGHHGSIFVFLRVGK